MDIVSSPQRNRIHPHKFALWVAMVSIIMAFAGLTSAYIVKSNLAGWETVEIPKIFIASTASILASSLTMQLALRAFKQREMQKYRLLLLATLVLGIGFITCQLLGFSWLWNHGVQFSGAGAGQFLYVIAGMHILHVTGGLVALTIMVLRSYFGKVKSYSPVPVEVMSMYWHFVDALWIYLLVFFYLVR